MRRSIPAVAATLRPERAQHVRPRRGPEENDDGPKTRRRTTCHSTAAPAAPVATATLAARRPGASAAVLAAGAAALCLGYLGLTRVQDGGEAARAAAAAASLGTLAQEFTEPVILGELAQRAAHPSGRLVRLRWREAQGRFLIERAVEYDPATGLLTQRVGGGDAFTFEAVTLVGISRALARGRSATFAAAAALSQPGAITPLRRERTAAGPAPAAAAL